MGKAATSYGRREDLYLPYPPFRSLPSFCSALGRVQGWGSEGGCFQHFPPLLPSAKPIDKPETLRMHIYPSRSNPTQRNICLTYRTLKKQKPRLKLSWELTRVLNRGNRRVVYPEIPFLFSLLREEATSPSHVVKHEKQKERKGGQVYVRAFGYQRSQSHRLEKKSMPMGYRTNGGRRGREGEGEAVGAVTLFPSQRPFAPPNAVRWKMLLSLFLRLYRTYFILPLPNPPFRTTPFPCV